MSEIIGRGRVRLSVLVLIRFKWGCGIPTKWEEGDPGPTYVDGISLPHCTCVTPQGPSKF